MQFQMQYKINPRKNELGSYERINNEDAIILLNKLSECVG